MDIEEQGSDAMAVIDELRALAVMLSMAVAGVSSIAGEPAAMMNIDMANIHRRTVMRGIATRFVAIIYIGMREKWNATNGRVPRFATDETVIMLTSWVAHGCAMRHCNGRRFMTGFVNTTMNATAVNDSWKPRS